jgi:cytochrome c biogenesis protein CcmG, thiol:disulfide interchange protein DsbE
MRFLKNLLIVLVCIASSPLFAQKSIPDVDVKTLDGKTVNVRDYISKGKITVLSFWATWCSPCKKELDAISEVYEGWQKDYNVQVLAITIDTQRDLAKVKPMVATKEWDYTILSDAPGQLKNALNFQSIPQMYLIDQKGVVVYEHTGYLPGDEVDLEKKIRALARK